MKFASHDGDGHRGLRVCVLHHAIVTQARRHRPRPCSSSGDAVDHLSDHCVSTTSSNCRSGAMSVKEPILAMTSFIRGSLSEAPNCSLDLTQ